MIKFYLALMLLVFFKSTFCQTTSRFSVEISHGVNTNFFVRSYDEIGGPVNKTYFYKKNLIGSISGAHTEFRFGKSSFLVADFFKTTNLGRKNYVGNVNGVDITVKDFRLRHSDRILSVGYAYQFQKLKTSLKIDCGFTLIYDVKQTIAFENWDNYISIRESNYKNSNSVEGGGFLGISWALKIDTKFDLGIRSRVYYLISTNEVELISLSPTLTYHFSKMKR